MLLDYLILALIGLSVIAILMTRRRTRALPGPDKELQQTRVIVWVLAIVGGPFAALMLWIGIIGWWSARSDPYSQLAGLFGWVALGAGAGVVMLWTKQYRKLQRLQKAASSPKTFE